MTENRQQTLLVTGAAGHLGRRVVELLLEAKAGPIVAATRAPEKLADFSKQGVVVRRADFEDPASLAEAFAGVDRLLLISTDAVGEPGRRLKQHRAAVKAAEQAGVSHVLYTSWTKASPQSIAFVAPDHYGTEVALADSKMGWTFLRNNIYADILIPALQRAIQFGGKLFAAAGDGKAAYVTREDCARAAAAALASSFVGQRKLEITGPEALSQADVASIASAITGQPITYIPLPLEVLVQNMVAAGLPQSAAAAYATFDTAIARGEVSEVSSAVEDITGRKPIRIADFLAAQRALLLQGPAH